MIEPLLVNSAKAAELLGMSRSAFYQFLSTQRIPLKSVKFGRKRLFDVEMIKSFVRSGCSAQWEPESK